MYKALTAVVVLLCACTNPDTTASTSTDTAQSSQTIHTNVTDSVITTATPMVLTGCYQMILKQDTAFLNLTVKDTTVTGDLWYRWYARDANNGTLQGVLRNDTIYGDYTFRSEGLTSVREVIFKIENGTLLQGFGDLTERNGKIVFTDKSTLQFQTNNPFLKVPCP